MGHQHMNTNPCWSIPRPGVCGLVFGRTQLVAHWARMLAFELNTLEVYNVCMNEDRLQSKVLYIRHESLPEVEGQLTLSASADTPVAMVGWPSSSLVVPFSLVERVPVAHLLASELVPPYTPLPSLSGPKVGQPLGRHSEPATPGVKPLMRA